MDKLEEVMEKNMKTRFVDNPCRGIVVGMNDSGYLIQLSWIMGRSDNSRNRVYVVKDDILRTEPADSSKVEDPSLIIYTAMRRSMDNHVVSNGAQTDRVIDFIRHLGPMVSYPQHFSEVLGQEYCEPDAPTFTPRITGYQNPYSSGVAYISVLSPDAFAKEHWSRTVEQSGLTVDMFKQPGMKDSEARFLFNEEISTRAKLNFQAFPTVRRNYELPIRDGVGYCVTTYKEGDHKSLNAFEGDPFAVPLRGDLEDIMKSFWNVLEPEWFVALGGKIMTVGDTHIATPINRYEKKA